MAKINSCAKGKNNERELCKILNDRFKNNEFKRTIMSGAYLGKTNFHRKEGLTEEQQNLFMGDVFANGFKFIIEHKAYKDPFTIFDFFNASSKINDWINQVELDAERASKFPLLIIKFNNKKRIIFIKNKLKKSQSFFKYKDWDCYWLTDLLEEDDDFFF